MKSGARTFQQILFDIVDPDQNAGRCCVVLHSQAHDPAAIPTTGEIPVNASAKALFFLHTAAWVSSAEHEGKALLQYVVTYADGSKETVSAIAGKQIRDWWAPGQCEAAITIPLSLRSETEADAAPRQRVLQIQEWSNPHADKQIRSIRIVSGETGAVPVVLGISVLKP
jgi:hypothetical protein